jgi:hypothetical protein
MIVVGARFRALAGARAALRAVRSTVEVAPGDLGLRGLGSTRYEAPAEAFVVAGRFEPEDVDAVVETFHAHGGRIIERRADGPRSTPRAAPREHSATPTMRARACRFALRGWRAAASRAHKRLRRPSPPLRVRTARCHRITS